MAAEPPRNRVASGFDVDGHGAGACQTLGRTVACQFRRRPASGRGGSADEIVPIAVQKHRVGQPRVMVRHDVLDSIAHRPKSVGNVPRAVPSTLLRVFPGRRVDKHEWTYEAPRLRARHLRASRGRTCDSPKRA